MALKFIEVNPGYSIRMDKVDSVIMRDQLSSNVTSGGQVFTVNIPYKSLMDLLNTDNLDNHTKLLQQIDRKVGGLPVFAG